MNKTAGGNFDGNEEGKRSQYAMVSVDTAAGNMYLSVVDANNQNASTSKRLGWRLSNELNQNNDNFELEVRNQLQATTYMNVITGDFDGNGIDEIAVFNPSETGNAEVEVYHLNRPPGQCDIYNMSNWEICQTMQVPGDNFVSMDAGDLNGDGVDDLVIGCDTDVTVYDGSRTLMLDNITVIDNPKSCSNGMLRDPSVAIIHEKNKQYLCVMNKQSFVRDANTFYYVCLYNPRTGQYEMSDSCLTIDQQEELISEQEKNKSDAEKAKLKAATPYYVGKMPLNICYANNCIFSPYFIGHYYKFNDGNLEWTESENNSFYNYVCNSAEISTPPIVYDLQTADLNGEGMQTVFYKVFEYHPFTEQELSNENYMKRFRNNAVRLFGKDAITENGHYLGAFTPNKKFDSRMYPSLIRDPDNIPFYAVVNTDDDTSYMHYTGNHYVEYYDPVVLAVLSSPPYFRDLATASGLEGEYAESTTTYGTTHGSSSSTSESKTLSAGVYVSIGSEVNILGVTLFETETEIETETSFTNEYEEASSIDYSVEYSTSSGTDAVVFYSFPTEKYEYETTCIDKSTGQKQTYIRTLCFPRNPCITTIDIEKYNSIAENYGELPVIDDSILSHKLGYPETYPTESDLGKYKNMKPLVFKGEWMGVGRGGSITQSQSIEMSKETATSYECSVSIATKVGAGSDNIMFGISAGVETGGGYAESSTSGSSFGAEVANLPDYAEDYGYGMSWKLFSHEGSYVDKNGNTVKFPVVDYLVSDVERPPCIPENLSQNYEDSSQNSIVIDWEYDDPGQAENFNIYRVINVSGRESEMLVGTIGTSMGVKNDRGTYDFSFEDDGSNSDGTSTTLRPGLEYEYYVVAERDPLNPPEKSVPSERLTAYTHSESEYPEISLEGTNGDKLTVYPDKPYTIKAKVNNASSFTQTSYKWQKYDPKKGWKDLKSGATLSFDKGTVDVAGKYRCRVDAVFYNSRLEKQNAVSAFTDIVTVDFKMRSVNAETFTVTCDNAGKPEANVVFKPTSTSCHSTPKGEAEFIIEGDSITVSRRVPLKAGTGQRASAKLSDGEPLPALPDGNYKVSVYYAGDSIFGSYTTKTENLVVGDAAIYPVLKNSQGKITNTFTYGDTMKIDFYRYTKDANGLLKVVNQAEKDFTSTTNANERGRAAMAHGIFSASWSLLADIFTKTFDILLCDPSAMFHRGADGKKVKYGDLPSNERMWTWQERKADEYAFTHGYGPEAVEGLTKMDKFYLMIGKSRKDIDAIRRIESDTSKLSLFSRLCISHAAHSLFGNFEFRVYPPGAERYKEILRLSIKELKAHGTSAEYVTKYMNDIERIARAINAQSAYDKYFDLQYKRYKVFTKILGVASFGRWLANGRVDAEVEEVLDDLQKVSNNMVSYFGYKLEQLAKKGK